MQRATSLAIGIAAALTFSHGAFALPASPVPQDGSQAIAAMPLDQALHEFGQREHLQLVYRAELTDGVRTHGAPAGLTQQAVLNALLDGTGLQYRYLDAHTVTVMRASDAPVAEVTRPGLGASEGGGEQQTQTVAPPVVDKASVANPQEAKKLEQVIVTGTRATDRTASESLAPIDIVSAQELQQTGTSELTTALARVIPSLNFPRPTVTGPTDMQRPIMMRGLSPDQVLVLVNGKRWHPSATVQTLGTLGKGSQSVDLNTIPMAAIDHVEVLRDGASAQYGSDAIAGVINIILKKGGKGGSAEVSGGQYSAGDGRQWSASANAGLPLGDKGWVNLTVQKGNQDYTNRSAPDRRPGYSQLGVVDRLGDPAVKSENLFLNMQYDITPKIQFYAFGHIQQRVGTYAAFYRWGSTSPAPLSPLIANLYPNGFLPIGGLNSIDRSLVAGLRGEINGWRWDVSANAGGNLFYATTTNTVNLAYLHDFGTNPSRFDDGATKSGQQAFDIDISKDVTVPWLPNAVTLAFGTEFLRASYNTMAGTLPSYYVGTSGIAGGVQGQSGRQPELAGSFARHDIAEYLSLETNLTDKFAVSVAGRHENYTDFGSTTSGAASARFDFTDSFALRGSISTGFRAPSVGQQHYSTTASTYRGIGNSLGVPEGIYNNSLVPVDNPVATLLGAQPLKPETSHNYSLGMVWRPMDNLNLTVDAYQIKVDNRIALSGSLATTTPKVRAYLAANGISNLTYSSINYFTNAIDTETRGIDLVGTYFKDLGAYGNFRTIVTANYNRTHVTRVLPNPAVLNNLGLNFQRVGRSEILGTYSGVTPRTKFIVNGIYNIGNWSITGVATRYGQFTSYNATLQSLDQTYPAKWIFDLSGSYKMGAWLFTAGVDNVFDTYPGKTNASSNQNGAFPYTSLSPFGFNGAYVYGKVRYSW